METKGNQLGCAACSWLLAAGIGLFVTVVLLVMGGTGLIGSIFFGGLALVFLGLLISWVSCSPLPGLRSAVDEEPVSEPATNVARGQVPGKIPDPVVAPAPVTPDPGPTEQNKPDLLLVAPDNPDDLKRIKGVGPKLAGALNEMGVYHFHQIAGWSDAEVAWVDENLIAFKGRVTRDDWVSQAKAIVAEDGT